MRESPRARVTASAARAAQISANIRGGTAWPANAAAPRASSDRRDGESPRPPCPQPKQRLDKGDERDLLLEKTAASRKAKKETYSKGDGTRTIRTTSGTPRRYAISERGNHDIDEDDLHPKRKRKQRNDRRDKHEEREKGRQQKKVKTEKDVARYEAAQQRRKGTQRKRRKDAHTKDKRQQKDKNNPLQRKAGHLN